MDQVDYVDTFIAVADDSQTTKGMPPPVNPDRPSVAARTYQMDRGRDGSSSLRTRPAPRADPSVHC